MRLSPRSLFSGRVFAPLAIALIAFPAGLIADQAANSFTGAHAAPSVASSMAGMDMSAQAAKGSKGGTVLLLHHKVIHITILNFAFNPAKVEVSPGTKIIWTNQDSDPHTVDSTKNVWNSEALDTDGTFARVFKATGTFPYYCSIHPFMHATVIVHK